ncbi:MAG: hypothetical protein KDD61_09220 [Bdellovibrionales bacterium]|nr:hypothetical protein [Bdellovibrionales bacterium]
MHKFYIPVMGTGFTIDSALVAAPYGVHSVLSLVDDDLIEQMREYHLKGIGETYDPIDRNSEDSRARRITAYLDLLDDVVAEKFEQLKHQDLTPDSELGKYFRMLPEGEVRTEALTILEMPLSEERQARLEKLKANMVCGRIDVNIMTKLNRSRFKGGELLPPEYADALAALRGLALAQGSFAVVFSAGMNAGLYSYVTQFDDFFMQNGFFKKQVVLKVSDYRSALIQGKFLAKKGVWVSEYRIESGLNCGGHAFATQGYLLGPILQEFKEQRERLIESLAPIYQQAVNKLGREVPEKEQLNFAITVQGGVGLHQESEFLQHYYDVDQVGWGTPFLLVPEVTRVDEEHLQKLQNVKEGQLRLSQSSPLGIRFWNLMNSASERQREIRIQKGNPGSSCPKGFIKLNTDYTDKPICRASKAFQKLHLKTVRESEGGLPEQKQILENLALAPSCICHDLAGGATKLLGIDSEAEPAICCGPNIVNFSKVVSFEDMINHIYGRPSPVQIKKNRPHQFIAEAQLYWKYLLEELEEVKWGLSQRDDMYFSAFVKNLKDGLEYYLTLFSTEQRLNYIKEQSLDEIHKLLKLIDKFTSSPLDGFVTQDVTI